MPQRIEPGSGAGQPSSSDHASLPRENVEADISTRNVQVTSNFAGTQIVVFGAVDYSRQTSAEAGLYDVVIVVVGTPTKLTARKKSQLGGVWLNTDYLAFDKVPSYYAIAATRPLDEVASPEVLKSTGVGFDYVPMELGKSPSPRTAAEVNAYRQAVVRLKRKDRLYSLNEYAVAFIGRSLFRASIDVPANVVVGPFETRVYLFRNGELLSQYNAKLELQRQGFEEFMYGLAFRQPWFYGLAIIALSMGSGFLAALIFARVAR
ncbi:MAG: TIGR02186 family protein [Proteobacteria bacterium]|nr:TIGR02186 family protein [Pseudomonadota bacterium]